MNFQASPVYYGGFDPGSGRAGLYIVPEANIDLEQDLLSIDSVISTGNAEQLLKRGDTRDTLADVIHDGETLITLNNTDYFLCDLVREGKNATDALGDPNRYWGDHARVLLLALASMLIPEDSFVLRLVTALPVTLYNKENRQRMKNSLSNYYRFEYNGRQREAYVIVGYVAMEGQGVLIRDGLATGEQAVLDIGKRTLDAIAADGQKLLVTKCDGNEELGVGVITDAIEELASKHGRVLPTAKIHDIIEAWANEYQIPEIRVKNSVIPEDEIVAAIEKSRRTLAKGIMSFVSSFWNVEGQQVGEQFEQITVAGGGAHYVGDLLKEELPRVYIPASPEDANILGYADLALGLENKINGVWGID